jgi:uncharacterized protein YggE
MRSLTLLGLLASTALAQPPAPPKGSVTADAAEVIRAKPDQAKLVFAVTARNADAATATDENDTQTKQFTDGLEKLKVGGVKVANEPLRVDRIETQNNGGGVGVAEYNAVRTVVVTVAEGDPAKLAAAVEKLQKESAKLGVGGETGGANYNGNSYERVGRVKVVYSRGDEAWEEQTAAALAKATKKATKRAEAMAAGAGLKLGELLSLGAPDDGPPRPPAAATDTFPVDVGEKPQPTTSHDTVDAYVDGELVRKVRVRVVYATTK